MKKNPSVKPIVKNGAVYYNMKDAGKLLGVRKNKVHELMGAGDLKYIQSRRNSTTFLIDARSLMNYKFKEN